MGLWWSQLCAVLHQGREVAGLTRQGGLVGWREKPHIFLKHCSFLPQGLMSSSLLFRWVKQETEISKESEEADTRPKLDLGFKEGQTIKLNIGVSRPVYPASFSGYADGNSSLRFLFFFIQNMTSKKGGAAKPRVSGSGGLSLLPPPPGGKIAAPPIPPPSSTAIANHVTPPPVQKSSNASSAGKP